jgi:hypothetical protein
VQGAPGGAKLVTTITVPTIKISQTTLNGYLTSGMVICTALLSQPQLLPQKYTAIIGGVLTILRIITGHTQGDAGKTLADVPGESKPQLVPSHEIPDRADAVAVKEGSGLVPTQTFPDK